jgi:monoamine oxidase
VGGDFLTEIGAAQTIRFVGGPQQLAERLARRLGRRVVRSCPVAGITQRERAEVRTARGTWSAREVILAVPLPLAARLHFDPPLPAAHDQLLQRQPLGTAIKVNAVYDRPFWRSRGLSGSALGGPGPIRVVFDNSPPDGAPGVLVGFFEGAAGARYLRAPRGARRRAALESFAGFFGERALRPRRYLELVWAAEPYTRGAYGSYNPPGVLTELGPVRRQPVGRVRFAGADLADAWPGYMEGAIHDGRRAADEVLTALR